MDNRMLALWTTPQAASAAFELMMRRRGDFRCLHEPFAVPYYRGADRRTTRFDHNAQDMSVTYASTWADIRREHRKGRVFVTDVANHAIHLTDGEFLDHFQHTFLIRNPATALPAMHDQWSTFTMDECSYEALRKLFEAVTERYGEQPVVIDADDLAHEPHRTIEAYCKAIDIPFLPEAMVDNHSPSGNSDGLRSIDDVPFLREMYDRCRPHYETMAQVRV